MEQSQKPTFARELNKLSQVFSKQLTPDLVEIYWETVRRLPLQYFLESCRRIAQTYERFPLPKHLREEIESDIPRLLLPEEPEMTEEELKRADIARKAAVAGVLKPPTKEVKSE